MRESHESIVEDRLSEIASEVASLREEMNEKTQNGEDQQLDCWAVVELFGHQKIAGKIKTVSLVGAGMLRVDVPAVGGEKEYTRFFGAGAIYSINPTSEQIATGMVSQCSSEPVHRYELPKMLKEGEEEPKFD